MSQKFYTSTLIIGSGPAGYTAAIYAARANLNPLLVTGIEMGGQMTITTDVENYPGFADIIQGPWLMEQMKTQAASVGTELHNDLITKVDFSKRPFLSTGDSGNRYISASVIIATGAQARWLGLESEEQFKGFGVSACATCDGFFYKEKEVAVVGGGNTAVEEAIYLTKHVKKVFLIHRRDELRAEKILQKRLFSNKKIELIWDTVIVEVIGKTEPLSVTKLRLQNTKTKKKFKLNVDGLFVAIGHDPATRLFEGHLNMDKEGYIRTKPDSTATNVEGVFAAGDVQDKTFRQAVTAAGTGCMAALEAEQFVGENAIPIRDE
ncbi:MAG: thioredoxin-disulfide reductase [Pseudomonadota bacterium]|nr:thioredoxin-disulfide reductase [Pseudomonadota bacterium]